MNRTCFIGAPEPAGEWATIQGEEIIRGTSSDLNGALRFACDWSLRYEPMVVLVKDVSGKNEGIYTVARGRVVQRPEGTPMGPLQR